MEDYLKDQFQKKMFSEKRYHHSRNVAKAALQLAEKYGEDQDRAYLAGLVHDICKEMDASQQYALMMAGNFKPDFAEMNSRKLWHGIAGAYFLQTRFDIQDMEILNAVRFHTVGRAGMSLLEEIIYIADMISEEREYKGVDKMRRLAQKNLQSAMLEALRDAIASVMKKEGLVPVYTIEAYNYYTNQLKNTHQERGLGV